MYGKAISFSRNAIDELRRKRGTTVSGDTLSAAGRSISPIWTVDAFVVVWVCVRVHRPSEPLPTDSSPGPSMDTT